MVPKGTHKRLSISMQLMSTNWQTWEQWPGPAVLELGKETKLKLNLKTRNYGDVVIVYCQGRIVYRDEAAALSQVVGEVLQHSNWIVLDLSEVSGMDGAGLGELARAQSRAMGRSGSLKYASPNALVRNLLGLTNLDRVLEVHRSLDAALDSFQEQQASYAQA
jgi:anti-sigma B factor antagonist